jgi:excisionase family DNA binding protein
MKKETKWFTIKEAANYLSIGEPTLYRWMRDGKITYRKIGDSTRFLQEDLDSFVQVFPSKKDSEKVRKYCPICHSDETVEGVFRSTGLNYFKVSKAKFWTIKDSNIKTSAVMCTQCGAITHFGDFEKLNDLLPESEDESE